MILNNDNRDHFQCNLSTQRCPMCNAENIPNNRPPNAEYSPTMERRKLSTRNSSPPTERRSRTKAQARRSQSEAPNRKLRHKPSIYSENYGHFADDLKMHDPSIYGKQRVGRARSRRRTISAQVSGPYSINYPYGAPVISSLPGANIISGIQPEAIVSSSEYPAGPVAIRSRSKSKSRKSVGSNGPYSLNAPYVAPVWNTTVSDLNVANGIHSAVLNTLSASSSPLGPLGPIAIRPRSKSRL